MVEKIGDSGKLSGRPVFLSLFFKKKILFSDAGVSDTVQLAAVAVGLAADAIEGNLYRKLRNQNERFCVDEFGETNFFQNFAWFEIFLFQTAWRGV